MLPGTTNLNKKVLLTEKVLVLQAFCVASVISWYDNEIGYSNKVLDLIQHMYSVDHK